jgi:hypothetical protein
MRPAEPRGRRSPHPSIDRRGDEAVEESADDVTPWDQIERRNEASRADADVLAPQRQAAASRALVTLQQQIERDLAGAPEPRQPSRGPDHPPASEAASPSDAPEEPLLEVKGSALGNEPEHRGERLVIFPDRVELRDRHDDLRVIITGEEIARVTVQRRITGAVLSVEGTRGPLVVARGLRPDQAVHARLLILREVRGATPPSRQRAHRLGEEHVPRPTPRRPRDLTAEPVEPGPRPASPTAPGRTPAPAARPPDRSTPRTPQPAARLDAPILTAVSQEISQSSPSEQPAAETFGLAPSRLSPHDEADLLRKLGDLHRAGVLTTDEYEAKIELVGQLVAGEPTNRPAR